MEKIEARRVAVLEEIEAEKEQARLAAIAEGIYKKKLFHDDVTFA